MTESKAAYILLDYPTLWGSWQERRQMIVDSYSADHRHQGGSGDHSDETFKKVENLLEMGEEETALGVVGEWITSGLNPKDRIVLLSMWRGVHPAKIENRYLEQCETLPERWRKMIQGLIRFAGAVPGGHGLASAGTRMNSRPVL